MYAAGGPHPHKSRCASFLERVGAGKVPAVIDAEVLQEILHRYRAIRRWSEGRHVYDSVRAIVPEVLPISTEVLDRARELLDEYDKLMARDALHAAVAECHSLEAICSFDQDFDQIRGIRRIEPR